MTVSGCQVNKNLLEFIFDMDAREDLLDCLLGNVVLFDEAGQIIFLNRGAETILGMSRERILGRSYWAAPWNLRGLDDPPGTERKDLFRNILETANPAHMELLLDRPDGCWGAYQVKVTPWINSGNCQGLMATFTDITDRRKTELERDRLADERERTFAELDAIIHSISHGVAIYDDEGRLIRANSAAENLSGRSPEPAEEGAPITMETPDGQPLLSERLPERRALAGERFYGDRMVFRHSPEKAVSVSMAGSPIFHNGKLVGAVLSFSDCSRPDIKTEQNQSFMQILANELRPPFGAIQGYGEMLKGDLLFPSWEQEEDCVSAIMKTSRKISEMVDELLKTTYLKDIDTGEVDPDLALFRPHEVVGRILQDNRKILNRNGIVVEIPENLSPICMEYGHIERIVLNLLTSALKLTPEGTTVRIQAEEINDEVVFAITGGGGGIEKTDLPKIFTRYSPSKASTKFRGMAFDLYRVRRLVEVHGGRVWVKTLPNAGNAFYFALPAGGCP